MRQFEELSFLPCKFAAGTFLTRLLSLRSTVISLQETSWENKNVKIELCDKKESGKSSPSRILSSVSVSTKLRSAMEIPHRIAPACPISPPPSTFVSTSTFSNIPLKMSGNITFYEKQSILHYFFLQKPQKSLNRFSPSYLY